MDPKYLEFLSKLQGLETFHCHKHQDQLLFSFIAANCPNVKNLSCAGFGFSSGVNLPHVRKIHALPGRLAEEPLLMLQTP